MNRIICGLASLLLMCGVSAVHAQSGPHLKTKIAIGRFSNETRYGQAFLRDDDLDPLGKQASDILSAYLVQTGRFLVFERPDLSKIETERTRLGGGSTAGVDTLIIGSVVEFGRSEDGKRGLLNRQRIQRAHAKVAIRLVDVRTGIAYFSATGSGDATTESKTTLGIGSTAHFDGTLTDKALSAATENMLDNLVTSLGARPWHTDVLAIEGDKIFIAGGAHQGLTIGTQLRVLKAGKTIQPAQSGMTYSLPPTEVARIEVQSLFGNGEADEGATTKLVSGSLAGLAPAELIVDAAR